MKNILKEKQFLFLLLTTCCMTYQAVNALCNVCQENKVACVNLTSYYMCFESEIPNTKKLFTCEEGLVCTDLPNICFQRSALPPSCDYSSCNKCNSNQVFACTSRTTFAFCFGSTIPSQVVGSCPPGKVCDASSKNFCVRELQTTSKICNLEKQTAYSYLRNIGYKNS